MVKRTQIYAWDDEPVDERPSEFRSTNFAPMSGYHPMMDPGRTNRPPPRFGLKSMLLFALVVLALGTWGLLRLSAWLRA